MTKKLSIGSWAYIFNQTQPTNDFHIVLHKLQDLGYEGVELGSLGAHPTPWSHPSKADRAKLAAHATCDDQGTRRRIEFFGALEDLSAADRQRRKAGLAQFIDGHGVELFTWTHDRG